MKKALIISAILVLCAASKVYANSPKQAAIASAHPMATQAGLAILEQGGNAMDAAVAIAAASAVVEPYGSGLGGGGFWLVYSAKTNKHVIIDAREQAPSNFNPELIWQRHTDTNTLGATAGIPGIVKSLEYLQQNYGQLNLQQNLQPAINIAANGFLVDSDYLAALKLRQEKFTYNQKLSQTFWPEQIDLFSIYLKQPELAKSLQAIAAGGSQVFYQGAIANKLITTVNSHGGNWDAADLANYQLKIRDPLVYQDQQLEFISNPAPSQGGAIVRDLLVKRDQLHDPKQISAALSNAYCQQSLQSTDPDFVTTSTSKCVINEFATEHTTHFAVVDPAGNYVLATLSLNDWFGSGLLAGDTGIILNNHLLDFNKDPKHPNYIAAGKRPQSTMMPSVLTRGCETILLGTPGGKRIASAMFLAINNWLNGDSLLQAISKPRFHVNFASKRLDYEPGAFTEEQLAKLTAQGYKPRQMQRFYGNMQAISLNHCKQTIEVASDPRRIGSAKLFKYILDN